MLYSFHKVKPFIRQNLLMRTNSLFIILLCLPYHSFSAETVLLTGGAGFIGSHTAKALRERDYRVVIVDSLDKSCNPTRKYSQIIANQPDDANLIFYHADILDKEVLLAIWEKEKPSLVCHLAAQASVPFSVKNPELCLNTNILGMLNLLDLAKQYSVKNFVFASSSSVYGKSIDIPFRESDIADRPSSPYAMSKRSDELLAYTYHDLYRIPCTGLRFFNVYGPNGNAEAAPFKFLHKIYHNEPITLFGDGDIRVRDFIYIDDLVDGIIKALEHPHNFEIFNLGTGKPVTLQEFITTIESIVDKKAIIIKKEVPEGDVDLSLADIGKAKSLLNYHPTVSLEEGMRRMFAWYLKEVIDQ